MTDETLEFIARTPTTILVNGQPVHTYPVATVESLIVELRRVKTENAKLRGSCNELRSQRDELIAHGTTPRVGPPK